MAVAATIGFFDGVHLGHRRVLENLVSQARERGAMSLVLTFWPHPRTILQQDAESLKILSSLEEKKRMILECGVDRVEVLPFTKEFSTMPMKRFITEVLIGTYGVTTLVLGHDNRMGSDCASVRQVEEAAAECSLEVIGTQALGDGRPVSSTLIRNHLESGSVTLAAECLGYNYSLHGVVVTGNKLGRTIGFPTANMQLYDPLRQIPGNGVYATKVRIPSGEYLGMTNIGVRPTVNGGSAVRTIETNIFEFSEDIYGQDISIEFLSRVRDEKEFASLDELARQLHRDRLTILNNGKEE